MEWIKEEGKLNDNTYLIDSMLFGQEESMACYLVAGTKKNALIDASGKMEGRTLIKKLKGLNLIPDILIVTHSHWDHAGGSNKLKKGFPDLEIMACHLGIESLKNPDEFNKYFSDFTPKLKPVENVTPLKDGDIIDLGQVELKIFETPGHTNCCISILDQKNKMLFIGDSIGYKPSEKIFLAPIMPPEFSEKKLISSIDKIKKIDYTTICPAHYGCLSGKMAQNFPEEAKSQFLYWKDFLISKWNENPGKKNMINTMKKVFIDVGLAEIEAEAYSTKFGS